MYYSDNDNTTTVIGSFPLNKTDDFKNQVSHMLESFQSSYQLDVVSDIAKILKVDSLRESYKNELLGDVMTECQSINVDNDLGVGGYCNMAEKLEQLFENSAMEILQESGIAQLSPIVGISLPILKKSYIEGHSKDIINTEVPNKPIIKAAFERRFVKDTQGNKHYIPDIFYDNSYKSIMAQGKGKEISPVGNAVWYPEGVSAQLPFQDLNILAKAGGSIANRDSLAMDFCIQKVQMEVDSTLKEINVNITPNMAANSTFYAEVTATAADGTIVRDNVIGQVDFYHGTVSVACTSGKIKKVQFGGHLSNEYNNRTVEIDYERETMEWKIPDGMRINTGVTLERIKDSKALFDFDLTTNLIADISTVLSQTEDSEILNYLQDSYDKWKLRGAETQPFGYNDFQFTTEHYFSCEPPANKFVTQSAYIETELKFTLNRFIDDLKVKLRNPDIMFVMYGHPNNVTLIQDNVRWVIDENTKIGGIQLDYKFGVMTANQNRIHVLSSLKCPKSRGLRVVAFPLTKEIITFKHYKYSLNIENSYLNPLTPLVPNIMGTSRYLTTEVLPVQGEFHLQDTDFGSKNPSAAVTTQVAPPVISLAGGTYTSSQTVTVTTATPGALIYYTLDGNTPVVGTSNLMNGSINVASTATLKVVAVKAGMLPSSVVSASYTISA